MNHGQVMWYRWRLWSSRWQTWRGKDSRKLLHCEAQQSTCKGRCKATALICRPSWMPSRCLSLLPPANVFCCCLVLLPFRCLILLLCPCCVSLLPVTAALHVPSRLFTACNHCNHHHQLTQKVWVVQEMMERERQTASSSLARERARANAAEQAADASSSQAEARRRQLQHDLDNAHSEVSTL